MSFEKDLVYFLDISWCNDIFIREIIVESLEKFRNEMSKIQGVDIRGNSFTGDKGYTNKTDGTIEYHADCGTIIIREQNGN